MKHSWPEGEGKCQNLGCRLSRRHPIGGHGWQFKRGNMSDWAAWDKGARSPGPCDGEPTPKAEKALQHQWQQLGGQCRRMGCPWVRVGLTSAGAWAFRSVFSGKDWDGERVPPCEGKS